MQPTDADSTFDDLVRRQIIDVQPGTEHALLKAELPARAASWDAVRIDVDFNERDGHGRIRTRVGDERRALPLGAQVVLIDPIGGIQTEGELVRIERDTGIAAFKVDWHGFEAVTG